MANNPYVNKVVYGNTTVMDISGDTVTASDVAQGKTFHDATGEQKTGSYVAPTITQITPSNSSPVSMSANTAYEPMASGYAIESYSSLAPSNSIPPTITSGTIYKASGNGKAIETFQNVSPSAKGNAFNAGFVNMSSGGYAHTAKQGFEEYSNNESYLTAKSNFDIDMTGFQAGTKFLVLLFYHYGSNTAYNRLDGASINNGTGTIRKLGNLKTSNATAVGTFYEVVANSQAVSLGDVSIDAPYNCFCQVYVAG